jgi:hypothetical protein
MSEDPDRVLWRRAHDGDGEAFGLLFERHGGRIYNYCGIGVAYVSRGLRDELIFDPQTSALLGEQQSVVETSRDNPFPPGSVIGWAAYLASGVVNSTSDTTSATP